MCNDQISLSFRVYHCHVLLTGVDIYVKVDEIWVCVWGGEGGWVQTTTYIKTIESDR